MRRIFSAPAALVALALTLSACGGGGGGGSAPPTTTPAPTPSPSSSPNPLAFNCPTSATAFSVSTGPVTATTATERRQVHRTAPTQAARENTTLLAVTYSTGAIAASTIEGRARTLGVHPIGTLSFDRLGRTQHVVAVDTASRDRVAASFRSMPGVLSVAPVQRRYAMTTNAYLTSDPYFHGTGTSPLYEAASNPGQWDMHVEKLEHAFAYSQPGNGSTITNVNALGSQSVKLAVIDTGMDVTHPELAGAHVVRTKCFITDLAGVQNTGSFVADPDGHGTDVTGIAGADVNNSLGFAGDAGNVSLMLYRVFPTPDDSCSSASTTDPQCGTAGVDVASAINDAVANGANVISMSFGGGNCTNGQDPDPSEGPAVANAIAHNVILVAASGNGGTGAIGAPGCDSGVIAVGASAWNDGAANGSGYTGAHTEYVTSYSQYVASSNTLHSASSWGIVAPGGDGASSNDQDDLHWIENIWTSTPFDAADAGDCTTDFYGGAHDCRILIDGTSMSTPHVAGAAALVLSVNSSYQSPSAMKSLLCSTADDISDAHQGCGRLNVYRAVATALHDPTLP